MIKRFIHFYQSQDSILFWSTSFSILVALFITGIWAINYPSLPERLPLFYSLPWGEEQLASLTQFTILPAIILLTILVNLIISWHLHSSQLILKRMLSANSVIISILLLITSLKIIYTFI